MKLSLKRNEKAYNEWWLYNDRTRIGVVQYSVGSYPTVSFSVAPFTFKELHEVQDFLSNYRLDSED